MNSPPYGNRGTLPGAVFLRLLLSFFLAVTVSMALFWSMQYLIATADRTLDDNKRGHLLDFVRVKREEIIERKKNKPKKPPPTKAPPPEPPLPKLDDANPDTQKIAVSAGPVETSINLSGAGFNIGINEGDYLPLVKVAPIYPRRATTRGIEGYCTVTYTVTGNGSVAGVTVIKDQCTHDIFIKPSLAAAAQFKYKPRVIDGQTIEVPGVINRFTYKLED